MLGVLDVNAGCVGTDVALRVALAMIRQWALSTVVTNKNAASPHKIPHRADYTVAGHNQVCTTGLLVFMYALTSKQHTTEPSQRPPGSNLSAAFLWQDLRMTTTNSKVSEECFSLMNLLPELRLRVYESVFENLADSIVPPSLSTAHSLEDHLRSQLRSTLALLHNSEALRTECIDVYSRLAKAHTATLKQPNRDIYVLIDEFEVGDQPSYKSFMELHAREMAMAKLGVMLNVVELVMSEGYGRHGRSFAALKAAVGANAYRKV